MEIKSHLFEIMQFCFVHSILLSLYLSVLLKPNFFNQKMKEYLVFSCSAVTVRRCLFKILQACVGIDLESIVTRASEKMEG